MIKTFFNDNLLPKVQKIIEDYKVEGRKTFLTSEAIKSMTGVFAIDSCSPVNSFNENYERFLREKKEILNIEEISTDISIKDEYGNSSKCSKWKIL